MDFTQFNSLSKDTRTDVALCALVKILTGEPTKHIDVMVSEGKDIDTFITTYGPLIIEIASNPINTIEALRILMVDE